MRKYLALALLLILFLLCGCAGAQFENTEKQDERILAKPFTVSEIHDDTAILLTEVFEIEYLVDARGLSVGEQKYFILSVWPCYRCREFRATILGQFHDKKQYRKALRNLSRP